PYGILGMAGNVSEWTLNDYAFYPDYLRLMKKKRFFIAVFLTVAFATFSFGATTNKPQTAQKSVLVQKETKPAASESRGGLIVVEIDPDAPPPKLPSTPTIARLFLAMNAVGAEVLVDNKLYGKTKPDGTLVVNTPLTKADITVRHPDFEEISKPYSL